MNYEKPEMDVITFRKKDIVTNSIDQEQGGVDGGSGDFGG